jgi:glucose-6-phosphate isomerase
MLPDLSAFTTGQILALYEHNTAVMVRFCGQVFTAVLRR